jgi:hypothetical protein
MLHIINILVKEKRGLNIQDKLIEFCEVDIMQKSTLICQSHLCLGIFFSFKSDLLVMHAHYTKAIKSLNKMVHWSH